MKAMKVHVTVDEIIYPELHALLEATPVSKRARVLANLAFKACLLSNVALMNSDIATPQKGRGSKGKQGTATSSDKPKRNTADSAGNKKATVEDKQQVTISGQGQTNNLEKPLYDEHEGNSNKVGNLEGTGVPGKIIGSDNKSDQQGREGNAESSAKTLPVRTRRVMD